MSSRTFVLSAMLVCTSILAAQTSIDVEKKKKMAEKGYLASLKFDNANVRNSAIFRVMQFHHRFPDYDMQNLIAQLQTMSLNDQSARNRLYAFIAMTYLSDFRFCRVAETPPKLEAQKDEYFLKLQNMLNDQTLTAQR